MTPTVHAQVSQCAATARQGRKQAAATEVYAHGRLNIIRLPTLSPPATSSTSRSAALMVPSSRADRPPCARAGKQIGRWYWPTAPLRGCNFGVRIRAAHSRSNKPILATIIDRFTT